MADKIAFSESQLRSRVDAKTYQRAQEYGESFGRMTDGVIKAMIANKPFPADGEAAWNEILFEAAVYRSALSGGARVYVADVEKDAMGV